MNKETIEIPLRKATYEELQEVICELQVERYIKNKEIDRLNNIISELEKSWKEQQEHYRYYKDNRYRTFLSKNLDKLKELKEKE